MEEIRDTVKCDCGFDCGETIEELIAQKTFSIVCKNCGAKIRILPLGPGDVLKGYPKR